MERRVRPELLDSDAGTPKEVAESLADLRRVNRWFGGTSTTVKLIERVERETGRSEFTLLDVAAGSGDIPETARQRLASRGITLWGTLLDRAETHLGHNGLPAVLGDGLALPFRDGSFDLVSSALFIHHLEPDGVVRFMREALRVCRLAVLINDLRRSPIHLALVYAGFPLYRSRLTRHDGPASVRRAYTPEELLPMLERAGAARIQIQESYLYRMGVIAWRRNTT